MRRLQLLATVAVAAFIGCDDNSPPPTTVDPAPTQPAPVEPAPRTETVPPSDDRYVPETTPDQTKPGANIDGPPAEHAEPPTRRSTAPKTGTIDDPDVEEQPATGLPSEHENQEE
jgi:hypothetical protein